MITLWIVGLIVGLVVLIWGIDVYRHRHPLDRNQVVALARKWQRNRALQRFGFSATPQQADTAEKKAMNGSGELVSCDMKFREMPSRIAGLLKYKKHEWVVIAFVRAFHVEHLWWNKGPNRTVVWSHLQLHQISSILKSLNAESIAILHNHPNPDPARYVLSCPSEADLRSAGFYDGVFSERGINLLEFICERGVPHLYYASFRDDVEPIEPIVSHINEENGNSILKNWKLQKQLKGTTSGDMIPGSTTT